MNGHNGNVPIIGAGPQKVGVATIAAMVHHLDANGEYEPESIVALPNGQPVAIPGRANFVTAVDLVAMIAEALRPVIREEIEAALDSK